MRHDLAPRSHLPGSLPLLLVPVLLAGCGGAATGEPEPAMTPEGAAATITAEDMLRHIGVLAHDSMAGRDTPSPELEEAAAYLARRFAAMGLEPAGEDGTFLDRFEYTVSELVREETVVRIEGADHVPEYEADYFMVPAPTPVEAPLYYVGIAGEAGLPGPEAEGRVLVYHHPGGPLDQEWQLKMMAALQPAMMSGAPALIMVLDPEFPGEMLDDLASVTAGEQAPFPVVGITDEAAGQLFASAGTDLTALRAAGEPTPVDAVVEIRSARSQEVATPPNVVARLPGSDPELADTYVVLTAHFDHIGVGAADETGDRIFNGADDDASGTAAVLEIAEALAALDRAPARSVIFLLVSGEEKGLLGSRAWVESPTGIPGIESVVANVNMDMVGRDPMPDTLIGIGQEYSSLEGVLQGIVDTRPDLGLTVILDPQPEEMYFFRSDQLPFIQQGVPAVFFTTGEHEDYHLQSDEVEKIAGDKAARVARLGYWLTWEIANADQPPEWTEEGRQRVEQMLRGAM